MKKNNKEVSDKITNINHSKNENFKKYEESLKLFSKSKEKDKNGKNDKNKVNSNDHNLINNSKTNQNKNQKKRNSFDYNKKQDDEKLELNSNSNNYRKTNTKKLSFSKLNVETYSYITEDMSKLALKADKQKVLKNLNCSSINQFYYKESQNIRPYMEDFCLIIDKFDNNPEKGFFLLLDGHGGSQVAQYVKDNLSDVFKKKYKSNVFQNSITETFNSIDNSLLEFNFSYDMGTTCSVVYTTKEFDITNGEKCIIHTANIGDSRVVLVNENKVIRLTYDHKASDISEKMRIEKAGGIVSYGRINCDLALSRSFGDFKYKKEGLISTPHIQHLIINKNSSKNDIVVMASDGIWDVIEDSELIKLASKNKFIVENIVEELVQLAKEKGSTDNISCLALKIF